MKNLFVSYEVAKQLKEKGFNDTCIAVDNGDKLFYAEFKNTHAYYNEFGMILYQQAVDFILSKNIFIGVSDFPIYNGKYGYRYGRGVTSGGYTPYFEGTTRHEALTEAIKQALKLI